MWAGVTDDNRPKIAAKKVGQGMDRGWNPKTSYPGKLAKAAYKGKRRATHFLGQK